MNQSLKFTPGPWKFRKNFNGSIDLFGEDGNRVILTDFRLINEQHNICLIAAAPELLEAAIALFNDASDRDEVIDHDNVGDGEMMYADWAALKKAIDKATGATA